MSDDPREAIITAARRAFYERGYDDTSFTDLARLSGIPKGNFYYYFKSKQEVLTAVLDARLRDAKRALASWEATLATPRDRLARFVHMLTASRDDLIRYGCPMGSLLIELGKKHDALQETAFEPMQMYVDWVARQLELAGQTGAAARTLAIRLLARCQGAVVVAQAYRDPAVLDAEVESIRAWVDELVGSPQGQEKRERKTSKLNRR